ncbi:MAG: hypothetical protein HC783_04815 [Rhodobacteraceae bacterium]|nr:hypothetical protein [Paracoccaceae bacterium]
MAVTVPIVGGFPVGVSSSVNQSVEYTTGVRKRLTSGGTFSIAGTLAFTGDIDAMERCLHRLAERAGRMDDRAIDAGRGHLGQRVVGRVGRNLAVVRAHLAVLPEMDLRIDDFHQRPSNLASCLLYPDELAFDCSQEYCSLASPSAGNAGFLARSLAIAQPLAAMGDRPAACSPIPQGS